MSEKASNKNDTGLVEPAVDAFFQFVVLLVEILFKSSCNLLIMGVKLLINAGEGVVVLFKLLTNTYYDKEPKIDYTASNELIEIASTDSKGVSILTGRLNEYKEELKEVKTKAIDIDYIELDPLILNNEIPKFANYKSNDKVKENTLIAYPAITNKGPLAIDFFEQGSLLIGGMSRWGKTSFILSMFTSLVERYRKNELRIVLVDFKSVDLVHLSCYENVMSECITDIDNFKLMLNWVQEEIKRRSKIFREAKISNIKDYNKAHAQKYQAVIIIVDEIAVMLNSFNKKSEGDSIRAELSRLLSISMGFGIYWVVCTQELSRETLGKMKNNFNQRIGFHTSDKDATDLIIKDGELEEITVKGRGKAQNTEGITEFQSYYITLNEVFKRLDKYKKGD